MKQNRHANDGNTQQTGHLINQKWHCIWYQWGQETQHRNGIKLVHQLLRNKKQSYILPVGCVITYCPKQHGAHKGKVDHGKHAEL